MATKQWLKEMLADADGYASSRRFGYIITIATICICLLLCMLLFSGLAIYAPVVLHASVFPTLAQFVSLFSGALLTAATAGYVAGGWMETKRITDNCTSADTHVSNSGTKGTKNTKDANVGQDAPE